MGASYHDEKWGGAPSSVLTSQKGSQANNWCTPSSNTFVCSLGTTANLCFVLMDLCKTLCAQIAPHQSIIANLMWLCDNVRKSSGSWICHMENPSQSDTTLTMDDTTRGGGFWKLHEPDCYNSFHVWHCNSHDHPETCIQFWDSSFSVVMHAMDKWMEAQIFLIRPVWSTSRKH